VAATGNAWSPRVADELMAPAMSVSQQSVDGDVRRFQMSVAGFLQDMPVLWHARSDTPGRTTKTGFTLVHVTSAVPGAVELCVPKSDVSRQAEWWHSARTVVGWSCSYPEIPARTKLHWSNLVMTSVGTSVSKAC